MKKPIRKIDTSESQLFLTFDDGPCPVNTPPVLDMLDEFGARATFFVIGREVKKNKELFKEILDRGHSIGDHSSDHDYAHYFKNEEHLKSWIRTSWDELSQVAGEAPVAFRSPAGIITPPLMRAIHELEIAWVHWNRRFFDSNLPLSLFGAAYRYQPGDILLLHDKQKPFLQLNFQKNLRSLLQSLTQFECVAIRGEQLSHEN